MEIYVDVGKSGKVMGGGEGRYLERVEWWTCEIGEMSGA